MVHSFRLHDFVKEYSDTMFNLVKCYGFKSVTPYKAQIDPREDFVTWKFHAVDEEISKDVIVRVRYYFNQLACLQ